MWEVWTKLERFDVWAPFAWFGTEEDAKDYADFLSTKSKPAEVMYNETAVIPDYHAPEKAKRLLDDGRSALKN